MTLQLAAIVAGAAIEIVAWRVVATGRAGLWVLMAPTFAALGVVALLLRPPVVAAEVEPAVAAGTGVVFGVLLFVATRIFVGLVGRWGTFQRHTAEVYSHADEVPLGTALGLSELMVAGEELFWRGLVQARLAEAGAVRGAAITWLAFVVVNLSSASLPIVAGAIVGGAVWAGLAAWSGGWLASAACHAVWIGLMMLRPPRRRDLR